MTGMTSAVGTALSPRDNDAVVWVEWIETGRFQAGEVLLPAALGALLSEF